MQSTAKIRTIIAAAAISILCAFPASALTQKEFNGICLSGSALDVAAALKNEGISPSQKDKNGYTPLIYVAKSTGEAADPEKIRILLNAGAKVDARGREGMTALMFAARDCDNPDMICTFVRCGADIEARNKRGWTPLCCAAARNPSVAVLQALFDMGADITVTENEHASAFMLAVRGANTYDILCELLTEGADPLTSNSAKKAPLFYLKNDSALSAEEKDRIKEMIGDYSPDRGSAPFSPERFCTLCSRGTAKRVASALKLRTSPEASPDSVTPLMRAASHNPDPDVISTLIKWGADENARDCNGATPLIYACRDNLNPIAAAVLLDCGARADYRDITGRGALDYARDNPAFTENDIRPLEAFENAIREAEKKGEEVYRQKEKCAEIPETFTALYHRIAEESAKSAKLADLNAELAHKVVLLDKKASDAAEKAQSAKKESSVAKAELELLSGTVTDLTDKLSSQQQIHRTSLANMSELWRKEMARSNSLTTAYTKELSLLKQENSALKEEKSTLENRILDLEKRYAENARKLRNAAEEREDALNAEREKLTAHHEEEIGEYSVLLEEARQHVQDLKREIEQKKSQHRIEIIALKSEQARAREIAENTLRQAVLKTEKQCNGKIDTIRKEAAEKAQAEIMNVKKTLKHKYGSDLRNEKTKLYAHLAETVQRITAGHDAELAALEKRHRGELTAAVRKRDREFEAHIQAFNASLTSLTGELDYKKKECEELVCALGESENENKRLKITTENKIAEIHRKYEKDFKDRAEKLKNATEQRLAAQREKIEAAAAQHIADRVAEIEERLKKENADNENAMRLIHSGTRASLEKNIHETNLHLTGELQKSRKQLKASLDRLEKETAEAYERGKNDGEKETREILETAYSRSIEQNEARCERKIAEERRKDKADYVAAMKSAELRSQQKQEADAAAARLTLETELKKQAENYEQQIRNLSAPEEKSSPSDSYEKK